MKKYISFLEMAYRNDFNIDQFDKMGETLKKVNTKLINYFTSFITAYDAIHKKYLPGYSPKNHTPFDRISTEEEISKIKENIVKDLQDPIDNIYTKIKDEFKFDPIHDTFNSPEIKEYNEYIYSFNKQELSRIKQISNKLRHLSIYCSDEMKNALGDMDDFGYSKNPYNRLTWIYSQSVDSIKQLKGQLYHLKDLQKILNDLDKKNLLFTKDIEEVYKGIKISERTNNATEQELKNVEFCKKVIKDFIDNMHKNGFGKVINEKFDKVVISDDMAFTLAYGKSISKSISAYAYFARGENTIYMPLDVSDKYYYVKVIYHEFGHYVETLVDLKTKYDNWINKFTIWKRFKQKYKFPSDYSMTNESELFAEVFAWKYSTVKVNFKTPAVEIQTAFDLMIDNVLK